MWLYFRFTLSLRDVEEMLAERGIDVTYETIRCWTIKFGPNLHGLCDGVGQPLPLAGTWMRWSAM